MLAGGRAHDNEMRARWTYVRPVSRSTSATALVTPLCILAAAAAAAAASVADEL